MIINVNNFVVSPAITLVGVKKSAHDSILKIHFSKEWRGTEKQVSFYKGNDISPLTTIQYGKRGVSIPSELLSCAGIHRFTVFGEKSGQSIVSGTGYLSVIDRAIPLRKAVISEAGEK
jgi:hypothetical protein